MGSPLRLLPVLLLLAGCESMMPVAAPASDAPPRAPLPAAFTCDGGTGPFIAATPPSALAVPPVPTAGQMTEQAAQAKRLFDAEKWKDAVMALQLVWTGQTGDDEGNKQLAHYHMAIALYRLHREDEAIESFRVMAARPEHLKHMETMLWLYKLLVTRPELLTLQDFSAYRESDVSKFNNANQRELYFTLSYVLGRERIAEGKFDEGRHLFAQALAAESPVKVPARRCLDALG